MKLYAECDYNYVKRKIKQKVKRRYIDFLKNEKKYFKMLVVVFGRKDYQNFKSFIFNFLVFIFLLIEKMCGFFVVVFFLMKGKRRCWIMILS